jgi:hypothetical protein
MVQNEHAEDWWNTTHEKENDIQGSVKNISSLVREGYAQVDTDLFSTL